MFVKAALNTLIKYIHTFVNFLLAQAIFFTLKYYKPIQLVSKECYHTSRNRNLWAFLFQAVNAANIKHIVSNILSAYKK
jgi:hypothetical protein